MVRTQKLRTYNPQLALLLLRLGLAAVFVYAAIDAWREPDAWTYFIPHFATHMVSARTALDILSVGQLAVAGLLIIGKFVRWAALASIALLVGIIIFNLNSLVVTFRDIGLAATAAALFFLSES